VGIRSGATLLSVVALLAAASAAAQQPGHLTVRAAHLDKPPRADFGGHIDVPWRVHLGDDSSWASPRFDDTGWELANPAEPLFKFRVPAQNEERAGRRGLLDEDIDARSDLYSMGVLLYECLTGRPPFEARSPVALIGRILQGGATSLERIVPDVPSSVSALIMQLLATSPADRMRSASTLGELLTSVL